VGSLGAGYGGVLLDVDPPLLQTAEYARLGVALDRNADGGWVKATVARVRRKRCCSRRPGVRLQPEVRNSASNLP